MEETRTKPDQNEKENSNEIQIRKPRVLCLHGFRTSGKILEKLISRSPENVVGELDLVFIDGPYLAQGKSAVEGIYDPPHFEWFQSDQGENEALLSSFLDPVVIHHPGHTIPRLVGEGLERMLEFIQNIKNTMKED